MIKREAISNIKNGIRMTHESFPVGDWVTIEHKKLITQEGELCSVPVFMGFILDKKFDQGWEPFVKETNHSSEKAFIAISVCYDHYRFEEFIHACFDYKELFEKIDEFEEGNNPNIITSLEASKECHEEHILILTIEK